MLRLETLQLSLLTIEDSQLPAQVDYLHSLVPLDLSHQKNATIFGYPSWVYKAQSSKDGNFYALRRLEGIALLEGREVIELPLTGFCRIPIDQRQGYQISAKLEARMLRQRRYSP